MKNFVSLILACFISFSAVQAQIVSNVNWDLDANQENIIITYNLNKQGNSNYFQVSVRATLNGAPLEVKTLSGDAGDYIRSGEGKRIIWNVVADVKEMQGDLKILVVAIDPLNPSANNTNPATNNTNTNTQPTTPSTQKYETRVPVWAGVAGGGGIGAAGIALIVAGLSQESDSKELYEVYESNLDPTSSIYTELSRDEYYEEANSKHKKGQWMTYGGIAALAGGAYIIINRIIWNKKLQQPKVSLYPVIYNGDLAQVQTGIKPGVGLKIRF